MRLCYCLSSVDQISTGRRRRQQQQQQKKQQQKQQQQQQQQKQREKPRSMDSQQEAVGHRPWSSVFSSRGRSLVVMTVLLLVFVIEECHCLAAIGRQKRRQRGLTQQGKSNNNNKTPPIPCTVEMGESRPLGTESSTAIATATFTTTTTTTTTTKKQHIKVEQGQEREILWGMAGQTSRRKRQRGRKPNLNFQDDSYPHLARTVAYSDPSIVTTTPKGVEEWANVVKPEDIESVKVVLPKTQSTHSEGTNDNDNDNNDDNDNNSGTDKIILADVTFVNGTVLTGIDPRALHQRTDNAIWMALRQAVDVTASELSAVAGNSVFTSKETLAQKKAGLLLLLGNSTVTGNLKACEWGLKMEPKALRQYCEVTGNSVQETGLHIRPLSVEELLLLASSSLSSKTETETETNTETITMATLSSQSRLLGASPDGLVVDRQDGSSGLLEIKCLWGRRHKKELPRFDHCPNRFFDQIQGQLAVCDLEWCDLMMYIPPQKDNTHKNRRGRGGTGSSGKNYCILRVRRDRAYWNGTLLPAVQSFCTEVDQLRQQQTTTRTTTRTTTTQ